MVERKRWMSKSVVWCTRIVCRRGFSYFETNRESFSISSVTAPLAHVIGLLVMALAQGYQWISRTNHLLLHNAPLQRELFFYGIRLIFVCIEAPGRKTICLMSESRRWDIECENLQQPWPICVISWGPNFVKWGAIKIASTDMNFQLARIQKRDSNSKETA